MKLGDVNLKRPANDGGLYFPKTFQVLLFYPESQTIPRALYKGVVTSDVGFANH